MPLSDSRTIVATFLTQQMILGLLQGPRVISKNSIFRKGVLQRRRCEMKTMIWCPSIRMMKVTRRTTRLIRNQRQTPTFVFAKVARTNLALIRYFVRMLVEFLLWRMIYLERSSIPVTFIHRLSVTKKHSRNVCSCKLTS